MKAENVVQKVALELGLPERLVLNTYKAYWKFVKDTIESLPLKEDLDEEQFKELRTNFNIPSLGKLCCTYDRYKGIKKMFHKFIARDGKDTKDKENKTSL